MSELAISDNGKLILDCPKYKGESDNLYSYEQMVSMYIIGMRSAITKNENSCKKSRDNPYYIMRNMNVGDSAVFKQDKYNAARSAASLLKKQYGCSFIVRKQTNPIDGVKIHVRRDS